MSDNRSVEHYRDHELVCEAAPATHGWYYTISIVSHHGDSSETQRERSTPVYRSDLDALCAGRHRGRALIDLLAQAGPAA